MLMQRRSSHIEELNFLGELSTKCVQNLQMWTATSCRGCHIQWELPVKISLVGVCIMLQQKPRTIEITHKACIVQRSVSILVK